MDSIDLIIEKHTFLIELLKIFYKLSISNVNNRVNYNDLSIQNNKKLQSILESLNLSQKTRLISGLLNKEYLKLRFKLIINSDPNDSKSTTSINKTASNKNNSRMPDNTKSHPAKKLRKAKSAYQIPINYSDIPVQDSKFYPPDFSNSPLKSPNSSPSNSPINPKVPLTPKKTVTFDNDSNIKCRPSYRTWPPMSNSKINKSGTGFENITPFPQFSYNTTPPLSYQRRF
ncbi:uncharacterized protein ASCRUDRAFT_74508 [Ascoidea rubescens DSM 1968]|uniref:Uncharacterized protein n=1 Tax=Ascoidea rubescens DSM 1968 TaxID=1344418 RepID=A0A1D2VNF1_9ASCO|nr:hypothetical protein ASCRUDRAFT_74508 [Ascoidea rubescens DSM 1968]ODV63119.1 hypothetical protein ASCRUDRAFT_74508 [Ascoidea rubescens DSM 1968]